MNWPLKLLKTENTSSTLYTCKTFSAGILHSVGRLLYHHVGWIMVELKLPVTRQDCADKNDLFKPFSFSEHVVQSWWSKWLWTPTKTGDKLIYASPDYMYLKGGIFSLVGSIKRHDKWRWLKKSSYEQTRQVAEMLLNWVCFFQGYALRVALLSGFKLVISLLHYLLS